MIHIVIVWSPSLNYFIIYLYLCLLLCFWGPRIYQYFILSNATLKKIKLIIIIPQLEIQNFSLFHT